RAKGLLERRFVDKSAEVVLIGELQRRVALIEPRNGRFERATRVEAGSARVGDDLCFGFLRVGKDLRPLGLEKAKVAHAKPGTFLRNGYISLAALAVSLSALVFMADSDWDLLHQSQVHPPEAAESRSPCSATWPLNPC